MPVRKKRAKVKASEATLDPETIKAQKIARKKAAQSPEDLEMLIDITERKEAAQRKIDARFRAQYQGNPMPTFTWRREGGTFILEDYNAAAGVLTKGEVVKYMNRTAKEMYGDRPDVLEDLQRCFAEKAILRRELQSDHFMPGRIIVATFAFVPPDLVMVHTEDITERKRTEELFRAQRDLAQALSATTSLDAALRLCLAAAIRVAGMDAGGIYLVDETSGDLDLVVDDGLSPVYVANVAHYPADSASAQLVRAGQPIYTRYHELGVPLDDVRRREGLRASVVIPVLHERQVIACLNLASHTLDEVPVFARHALEIIAAQIGGSIVRLRAGQALHESEERYQRITEAITDYIYTVRVADGRAAETTHGPGCLAVTGYREKEFANDPFLWFRMVAAEDRPKVEEQARRILAGEEPPPLEHRIVHKNGKERWVRNTFVPYRDEHGALVSYDGLIQDITERKRVEEEVRQLQKAESLGRMAGAIAHHFNNQLGVVMGNLELALIGLSGDPGPRNNLMNAMKAARRSSEVSGLMLTYLGQTISQPEPLALSEVCSRNLPMLQAVLPKDVVLETDLPSPGPIVNANANQIRQILTNLVTNAWEAMDKVGGAIHVTVKTVSPDDIPASHRFPIGWQPQDKAHACLEVRDTGCGIAEQDIDKLFDPFFSSKFTGRGLGLPVVLGIARAHEGAITVESEPGRGSVFRVFILLSAEEVPRRPDQTIQAPEI